MYHYLPNIKRNLRKLMDIQLGYSMDDIEWEDRELMFVKSHPGIYTRILNTIKSFDVEDVDQIILNTLGGIKIIS